MVWECFTLTIRLIWRRLGLLLMANVVWLGLSLLILPAPAATAGLCFLIGRVVSEELDFAPRYARLSDFWRGMQQHGWRATVLGLFNAAALVLLLVALRFYGQSEFEPLRWLIGPVTLCGLVWLGAQLYLMPLLLFRTQRSVGAVIREALLMTLGYAAFTASLVLTALLIVIAAAILAGPVLLILFAFLAMLSTLALRFILILRGEIVPVRQPGHEPVSLPERR